METSMVGVLKLNLVSMDQIRNVQIVEVVLSKKL
jgi:hypothetical protein